jgi:hypothetical protein
MRAQITLTVPEGKRVIAEAIYALEDYQRALKQGKILLKGGTTVSVLAEKTVGIPLRISGRVSALGTKAALIKSDHPHSILIENGRFENVDARFLEVVLSMGREDIIVIGANAIDVHGNAAMMAGSPGGGIPGEGCTAIACEGMRVIIACGQEKLIPGNLANIVKKIGRKLSDVSQGMSVGLIPLYGDVITEAEALSLLADVNPTIIGKGGLDEGSSALTMVIDGEKEEILKVLSLMESVRGARTSGLAQSMAECEPGSACPIEHIACSYRNPKLLRR